MVIPTFNGLPFLQEAFESVRSQTYPNVEICLCDGGSTDGTVEWIRDLGSGIQSKFLPTGTSPAANWTASTAMATGEYIKLLCQDDVLYPDALDTQVHDLLENPSALFAVAQRDVITASGRILARERGLAGLPEGCVSGKSALRKIYLGGTNILGEPHTILFKRDALTRAMPWDDQRPYLLDLDTYTKLLTSPMCEFVVRRRSIGAFRVSSSSWSTRLVAIQRDQIALWQRDYELDTNPSRLLRLRARLSLYSQSLMRRLAYMWLRARRDMSS